MGPAELDRALYVSARSLAGNPSATSALRAFSQAGENGALWIAIGAAFAAVRPDDRRGWQRACAVVAATTVATIGLKHVLRRPRPVFDEHPPLIHTRGEMSFPSAHAASSFAAAGLFCRLAPRVPWHAAAAVMAGSRVVLGVHYPSDVVVGAAIGAVVSRATR